MKKEYNFLFEKGKFHLYDTSTLKKTGFQIDYKTLEFDTKKFYDVLFKDINELTEINISYCCSELEPSLEKISRYVHKHISELTTEICMQLNKDCFSI